jgi:hypothetical protein
MKNIIFLRANFSYVSPCISSSSQLLHAHLVLLVLVVGALCNHDDDDGAHRGPCIRKTVTLKFCYTKEKFTMIREIFNECREMCQGRTDIIQNCASHVS